MKIHYWNARGVANLDTRLVLKNMLLANKPDLLFIAEPWVRIEQFPSRFFSRLNL